MSGLLWMVSAQVHISHLFIALQIQRTETFAAASWEVSQEENICQQASALTPQSHRRLVTMETSFQGEKSKGISRTR